jgi:hypothetical protein
MSNNKIYVPVGTAAAGRMRCAPISPFTLLCQWTALTTY